MRREYYSKGTNPPKTKKYFRPTKSGAGMTKGQKASAVKRKRAAGNPGGKPTNVKTFA